MVLFIFVVMMLNLGPRAVQQERQWLNPKMWVGPALLAFVLMVELVMLLTGSGGPPARLIVFEPKLIGTALFGPYLLGVELASMLLLAGLVGAYHLGRRDKS